MFRPSAVTVNQPSLMLTGLLALGVAGCGGSGEDIVRDWTQYDSPQYPFAISYPAHWVPASSERLTRVALLRAAPNGTEITSDSKFFAVYEVGDNGCDEFSILHCADEFLYDLRISSDLIPFTLEQVLTAQGETVEIQESALGDWHGYIRALSYRHDSGALFVAYYSGPDTEEFRDLARQSLESFRVTDR